MNNRGLSGEKVIAMFFAFALIIVISSVIYINTPFFGYINKRVASDEVGVELIRGEFIRVVPPGVYQNLQRFADMKTVNVSAIEFSSTDPEVLTADQQRIGLVVSGTVTRPGIVNGAELTSENWRQYQALYTNDKMLIARVAALSQQAMKVCVGDRTFEEAAIGATRNDLRICIQDEIRSYALPYFLTINNVIVPEIIISLPVQEQLDQITAARNERLLAEANADLATANAETNLATSQGEIMVQQGIIQERERQQSITADLERQRLEAELAVITAQSENDIANAEYDVQIAGLKLEEARLIADADLAGEVTLAELLAANPEYAELLTVQAQALAVGGIEFAYVPVGTDLFFMFDDEGVVTPVINVDDQ